MLYIISATVPGACGGNEVECSRVRAEGPQPCSLELNQLINLRGPRGSGLHTPPVGRMNCLEY